MLVQNKAKHTFQHSFYDTKRVLKIVEIKAGEIKEIEDSIAQKWLKTGLVVKYVEPEKAQAKEDELLKEIERLKAENAKLKSASGNPELEALKKEADELDIQYSKNIGIAALQKKIEEKKAENA